jgi:hypothetical protein
MKRSTLLGLVLALAIAFAGCHEPAPVDEDPIEVTLTVLDAPASVGVNETFNVTIDVAVDQEVTSVHSGIHYGLNSSAEADPVDYTMHLDRISPHILEEHTFPGTYTVTDWSFGPEYAGQTIYYRAHTIIDGEDYWGEELTLTVEGEE